MRSTLGAVGLATLLTVVGAVGDLPDVRVALAEEPLASELVLPRDDELPADAQRRVDDAPPPTLVEIDVGAVIARIDAMAANLSPAAWDVAALVDVLGTDPVTAFEFVRDRIGFDPYAGVLRGAEGTLAARAGNAHDRALLLKALLDGMGVTSRFAFAELERDTAAQLVARAFERPTEPLEQAGAAAIAPFEPAEIANRARRDHALLRAALGERADAATPPDDQAALEAAAHHAWVQVADGESWVDYDPSFPLSRPGESIAQALRTVDAMPPEERQAVTIGVVAETLIDGTVYETPVLERRFDAEEAADADIFLAFVPDSGSGGVNLLAGAAGTSRYLPVLLIDDDAESGTSFPVGDGDDAGFADALSGGSGEALLGIRLDVTRDDPVNEPQAERRMLIDRVPADARAAGVVTVDGLSTLAEGTNGPAALERIHHLLISTGGADPRRESLLRRSVVDATAEFLSSGETPTLEGPQDGLRPMAAMDRALVVASDHAALPAVDNAALIRSYVGRPRVYVVSIGPAEHDPAQLAYETDLMVDELSTIVADAGAAGEAARRRAWYGVLMTAFESELVRRMASGFEEEGRAIVGASFTMDAPLTLLSEPDAALVPPGTSPALARALREGRLALVAGDIATATTWWTYEPSTGAIRSIGPRESGGSSTWGKGGSYTIKEFGKGRPSANVESGILQLAVAIGALTTIAVSYTYAVRSFYQAYIR